MKRVPELMVMRSTSAEPFIFSDKLPNYTGQLSERIQPGIARDFSRKLPVNPVLRWLKAGSSETIGRVLGEMFINDNVAETIKVLWININKPLSLPLITNYVASSRLANLERSHEENRMDAVLSDAGVTVNAIGALTLAKGGIEMKLPEEPGILRTLLKGEVVTPPILVRPYVLSAE